MSEPFRERATCNTPPALEALTGPSAGPGTHPPEPGGSDGAPRDRGWELGRSHPTQRLPVLSRYRHCHSGSWRNGPHPTIHDGTRRLGTFNVCHVGQPGFWTLTLLTGRALRDADGLGDAGKETRRQEFRHYDGENARAQRHHARPCSRLGSLQRGGGGTNSCHQCSFIFGLAGTTTTRSRPSSSGQRVTRVPVFAERAMASRSPWRFAPSLKAGTHVERPRMPSLIPT